VTISELIYRLEELRAIYGNDLPISVSGMYGAIGDIENVEIENDEFFIISDIMTG
jgi:hypothetical protein